MASKLSPALLTSLADAFRTTSRSAPSAITTTTTTSRIPLQRPSMLASSSTSAGLGGPVNSITRKVCASALAGANTTRSFSSSTSLAARKRDPNQRDRRITLIRYFLYHPLTPSPLRFSRDRYLRHWTIHRAWQLHLAKQRKAHQMDLQRQYGAMVAANEELRVGAGDDGWLFKMAMRKVRLYKEPVPIEYGRLQTETPSKSGWNYEWKREVE